MNVLPALCFAAALVVSASVSPGQEATSAATSSDEILRTYGEESSINVEEEWQQFSEANEGLIGSLEARRVSFAEALETAHSLTDGIGGKKLLAAVRAKFPKQDAYSLFTLCAVRETMLGHPATTLVLLVGALDERPGNPDALFNVASVLAGLGYANEALAILEELQRQKQTIGPPMGLTAQDAQDYLRGYCLARLGDKAHARALLEPIHARQPLLAEAPRMLALIDEAEEKDHRRNFLRGVWRRNVPRMVSAGVEITKPDPDPFTDGKEVAIDMRSFIDLEKGTLGKLPPIKFASTPETAKNARETFEKQERVAEKEGVSYGEQLQKVKPRGYRHTETSLDEVWGYRMDTLLGMIHIRDAKLRQLERTCREADIAATKAYDEARADCSKRFSEALARANDVRLAQKRDFLNPYETGQLGRPFYAEAMEHAGAAFRKREQADRDYFAEWHLLATALAGRVGDPAWREVLRLRVERKRQDYYRKLLRGAAMHAQVGEFTYLDSNPFPPLENGESQSLAPCDSSRSVGFGINKAGFGEVVPFDLGVELTCEGFSVEAGIDVMPMLSVSGEIGFDTKGQFSAFVGPKMDASLRGQGVTVKEGFYVSANRDGVQEAGAKIETKMNATQGAVGVSRKIGDTSLNFLPAPQNAPPAGLSPLVITR